MTTSAETWNRLADLIEYPDAGPLEDRVDACLAATAGFDVASSLERFRSAIANGGLSLMQERYVEAFDFDPACSLDVTWHLLGDVPERGACLSHLREDLARTGVTEGHELPDHLPTLLRLIAREERAAASELAAFIAPAVAQLHERLNARGNPFGEVMDAIAQMLARLQRQEEQP